MKWITLSGIYYWCDAAAGNSIYISTGAVPGRVSVASRIDGREHRFAAGAVMKFAKIQILGRYEAAMKERKLFPGISISPAVENFEFLLTVPV